MTIVITLPGFHAGEAERIAQFLQSGEVGLVHLRKPGSSEEQMEELVSRIPQELYGRLVVHDHFGLAVRYGLYGVHLNSRNPSSPSGWTGSVSRSCHSIGEVAECKARYDYVSLSPIFDSISKKDYKAAFSREELLMARDRGIIDSKVMALGGVTFDKLSEVRALGFGGGMILGDAWKDGQG